jgi:hypothetical protein
MSLFSPFRPLLRALTGGRYSGLSAARPGKMLSLDREWCDLLGLPPTALDEVLEAGSLQRYFRYRHFTRPKKDGGRREIVEPDSKLKHIQHQIIRRYFTAETPHPATVAYQKKKSIAHHVWPHAGADLLITADIEDFFPATSASRVEDWWRERVGDGLARLLTLLTTYQGGLPQGAPTSPELSNLLNYDLDERLAGRGRAAGAVYTRYCDDMVFSWSCGGPPSDFETGVRAELHAVGYRLHPTKGWQVHERRDEPEITGLVVTRHGWVRLPESLRQTMRGLEKSSDPRATERLAGYRGYEAMVRNRPRH